jgi:hypothetical protein
MQLAVVELSLLLFLFSSTRSAQCSILAHGIPGISFAKIPSRPFSRCSSCSQSTCEHRQLLFARPHRRCQRTTQDNKSQCKKISPQLPHYDVLIPALFFFILHRPFVVSRHLTLLAAKRSSTSAATGPSPSYRTTSRTTRSPSSAMVLKATGRA